MVTKVTVIIRYKRYLKYSTSNNGKFAHRGWTNLIDLVIIAIHTVLRGISISSIIYFIVDMVSLYIEPRVHLYSWL